MINNTFDLLWRDISPFAVGFDRTFDTLALLANSNQQSSNYPPYNIRKLSDDQYTIELALAGFEEKEIDIEASGENLVIKGSKDKDASEGL
ncbi:MAG TPA: Hsp20 family protein, partial [SAR86 cluster bacterium]|nr:Hsp20 family protein [SAR86 cluster bacterium]